MRVIDHQAFEQDTNLRRIDLPSSLEVVGADAFRGDTHLDSVIFPEGLTYLGGGALMECSGLTYVHLPQNLEVMQPILLYGTDIESFVVPPHVQAIAYEVFAECPRLHKVTLPASVTTLYWGLFDNSPLDTLVIECTVPPRSSSLGAAPLSASTPPPSSSPAAPPTPTAPTPSGASSPTSSSPAPPS